MDDLIQIKLPPKGRKCIVKDCRWHTDEVLFFGEMCPECYAFVTGKPGGEFSQAFKNAMTAASIVLRTRSIHIMAAKVLQRYGDGNLIYWRKPNEDRTGDSANAEGGTETGRFDCSGPNESARPSE